MAAKAQQDLQNLEATVGTTKALVLQLRNAVKSALNEPAEAQKEQKTNKSDIDVLGLSYDAASLIKAHSTKLSLLIINKPFTPTAICTVLRELGSGPLPALASAVELCNVAVYTKVMRKELQWRVDKVYGELHVLLSEIPSNGAVLSIDQKNGTGATVGKGSLANTGVVWQACDDLMALKALGIVGLVIKKADQYRDTLKDALEELQEWGEEVSDGEDDDDADSADVDDEDSAGNPTQDAIDSMFNDQSHIPRDDVNKIRERLDSSLRRLKLMILMYQAVIKRRFKTLPILPRLEGSQNSSGKNSAASSIIQCLDEVISVLKKIPDIADELANAFYELDTTEIDRRMDECFFTGFAATELLVKNWEGEKDEFSIWVSSVSSLLDLANLDI